MPAHAWAEVPCVDTAAAAAVVVVVVVVVAAAAVGEGLAGEDVGRTGADGTAEGVEYVM